MQRIVLGLATAISIGAGVLGYYGANTGHLPGSTAPPTALHSKDLQSPQTGDSSAEQAGSAATAPATQNAGSAPTSVKPVRSTVATDGEAPAPGELRYRRTLTQSTGETAEVCLVFSAPLDATGSTNYADYLKVGKLKLVTRVDGARLCLSGFGFGADYSVELQPGLPGAAGEKLADSVPLTVGFGDRPASVSFGSGFVLPRESADGLPVTTVNIDSLAIKVVRVGDRLLARMRSDLVDERSAAPYEVNDYEDDYGRVVWSGSMPVTGPRNDAVTSLIPLADVIGTPEPGAYVVLARNADTSKDDDDGYYYGPPSAMQWVVHSDLGVTSFRGADGLTVMVRSLASAKPSPKVRLTLIARNNEELATATTDAEGKAHFDVGLLRGTGGMAPVMVMAYAGQTPDTGDFTFLDLRRPVFDLSDRGVDGRDPAGPVDAFLYTERGIYRPGETVELMTLLRDPTVHALTGRTATIQISRPDGKEYRRFTIADQGGGASHLSVPLPATAQRGMWEAVALTDPDSPPVGRISFEVQDFVPQRLGLSIGDRPTTLKPGDALSLSVEARFLYGAPASALGGEADLTVEPDPAPFPKHKGFRWGMVDERFQGSRTPLEIGETDEAGRTMVSGAVPQGLSSTLPLRADIGIAIREPGGRATGDHVYVPLLTKARAIGVRPHFEDSIGEGQEARFDIITLDPTGQAVAATGLQYQILKDRSTWQWFRNGSQWRYERVAREVEVASGRLDTTVEAPTVLGRMVQWGSYRLVVRDAATGAATSLRFYSGWYGETSAERPDRLKVASDRAGYGPGDTARLRVESDFAGEALVVIANEQVHETRLVSVPAGGTDIPVKINPDWGAGAYALVTLYRPLTTKTDHAPVRGVGVAWLGLDPAPRTLTLAIGTPERIAPRQTLTVPVTVTGGDKAFVTLAAVDQGILQLTRFKTPSPTDHYLSKRRLGVGMRDDYGRLIRPEAQSQDQGGDGFGGKGLDVVPTRTVALFSGLVAVGPDGKAEIPLEIPDFQGELRLMAVAFDGSKVGSSDVRLTVRDPLVAEVILPRFLAPGDTGEATVLLHNVDGIAGDYHVSVAASDAVSGGVADRTVPLPVGKREIFTVPLSGSASGIGTVSLSVKGPGTGAAAFAVDRSWPIQIRPPQLPETRQTVDTLAPGADLRLDASLTNGMVPGTASVAVSLSRWQGLDVPGLLRWLDRYPFGCLEQTTSRALPLLYFNDVALLAGNTQDRTIDARVQDAIDRIQSMQMVDGSFSMWGGWGDEADSWLSVYALDFLTRAADKGFDVSPTTLDLGRRWLNGVANYSRPDVRAYASAVLARTGQANVGTLRYMHDNQRPKDAIALAHLGAALDAVGDRARAASSFDLAQTALAAMAQQTRQSPRTYSLPYGSSLRDAYAMAAGLSAAGRAARIPAVLDTVSTFDTRAEYTTTQEKAWMLVAAAEMGKNAGKLSVSVDGNPVVAAGDPVSVPVSGDALSRGMSLSNTGSGDIFRIVSVEGVPADPLPASSNGITLSKAVFTLDGTPVPTDAIRRNDRLVVVVEGSSTSKRSGDYAILDLLPAGWEIEGVLRAQQPGYDWLGSLTETRIQQARDDRYVASVALPAYEMRQDEDGTYYRDWDSQTYRFRLAYVVRAVTPGQFTLPAAVAEHMYVPRLKARTAMGHLTVTE